MATARSEELRAVARRFADALPAAFDEVVLTGSVSRGDADELSDIELLVVSEVLPESVPLEDVQTWAPGVEGAHWFGGFSEGEFIELVWWSPAYADERVHAIAAGAIVDHARLRTAEAITNGIALRGRRHAAWAALLTAYPTGLRDRIVADVLDAWIEPVNAQRSVMRDGDALVLAERLVEDAEGILRIVFALNGEWEPGWKRLTRRVESLRIKPERLAERIDAAIRALDPSAMRLLAAETLALAPGSPKVDRAVVLLREPL